MILLYTGASSNNLPQINSNNSLGGFVSSTAVPNGRLANIFSSICKSDVLQDRQVIRLIALKNISGADKENVKIYTDTSNSHVKLKIAAVAPILENNVPVFEAVLDGASLPYQAELNYQEGEANAVNIGTLAANGVVGIWILREIDIEAFEELNTEATGKELATILEAAEASVNESVILKISWD